MVKHYNMIEIILNMECMDRWYKLTILRDEGYCSNSILSGCFSTETHSDAARLMPKSFPKCLYGNL